MNRPLLRTRSVPEPGTYLAGATTGDHLDAVALASLMTAAGPLHVRLPVLAAAVVIDLDLRGSWLQVDLDADRVRTSVPKPFGATLDRRLGEALGAVRLETFASEELHDGRFRAHADLYAADGVSEISLDARLVEVTTGSLRLALEGRIPRGALGLDLGRFGRLAASSVRLVIALHATSTLEPSEHGQVAA
jgi:hypothetical protein